MFYFESEKKIYQLLLLLERMFDNWITIEKERNIKEIDNIFKIKKKLTSNKIIN